MVYDWKTNYLKNRWVLCFEETVFFNGKTAIKTKTTVVPPTRGDRIDVIGTSGMYYYNMTKKKWNKKDIGEYVDKEGNLVKYERPCREIRDEIAYVIHIKNGEISDISGKF